MSQDRNHGQAPNGYLAVPSAGSGPGVLVFHAWWGLNAFFPTVCDRLADAGFVAFAPDLYQGRIATTIEEAEALRKQSDNAAMETAAMNAFAYLTSHSAVSSAPIATLGFSMGAGWAAEIASQAPAKVAATVLFYGAVDADFAAARAAYQCHFAADDPWEPSEYTEQMQAAMRAAGRDVTCYTYPNVQHWFMETDRPEYNAEAAGLAWQRTIDFVKQHVTSK
jgi:carboxymethylenebutenolidase